ncbi:MAG: hypothetical protein ACLTTU_00880 [Bilophila wadsworthia]
MKDTEEGFVPVAPNLPEALYVSGGVEAFPEPVRSAFPESGTGKFTYRGPLLPILRLMGHKRPGKNHYTRLVTGLTCLAHGTIELVVRERGQETFYDLTHIISNLRLRGKNDAERDISVTISPFFREMYVANRLTLGLTWPNVFRSGEVLRRLCIASASRTGKILFFGGISARWHWR